ncbi:cob(I)yrinic acid a,c-diamide adenosyltransferase [Rhodoligotrophos ferricapiens]|uniref:cob(I)yrinic acid a,c-diamide adenosyltransferase n=1 Tax=Rhodoligotrophos ferricapiens TaxID=3069264 RepID=UPI00315CE0A7
MVVLNKIYTRTGDDGTTALSTGERLPKSHLRIEAYGTVDETNATIGVARAHLSLPHHAELDPMLESIQNDLFDLGADLCTPDRGEPLPYEPLRIVSSQVERLEKQIDTLNAELSPLRSFVLPAGHPAAAALHVSRTVCRRAERLVVQLASLDGETVGDPALRYINRLSDFLFVASRWINARGPGDVLWTPGANR